MPSTRRSKQIAIAAVVVILFLIYVSRDTTTQTFYTRTVKALDAKQLSDETAASKLRTIKDTYKDGRGTSETADGKGGKGGAQKLLKDKDTPGRKRKGKKKSGGKWEEMPSPTPAPSSDDRKEDEDGAEDEDADAADEGDKAPYKKDKKGKGKNGEDGDGDKSVAGRKKMKNPKNKEERLVEAELNQILKRSPIIIFSKTWCPYSAKAKRILLEKYSITPRPHVVELDQHPLGAGMQNLLEKMTGRRTVPNILVNGKSIGGGDDIEAAEIASTLVEKLQNMAGKRITKLEKIREGD